MKLSKCAAAAGGLFLAGGTTQPAPLTVSVTYHNHARSAQQSAAHGGSGVRYGPHSCGIHGLCMPATVTETAPHDSHGMQLKRTARWLKRCMQSNSLSNCSLQWQMPASARTCIAHDALRLLEVQPLVVDGLPIATSRWTAAA
jgi:hypothetical protein